MLQVLFLPAAVKKNKMTNEMKCGDMMGTQSAN